MTNRQGRSRAVIEGVEPQVDGGRFPVKRTVHEPIVVEADVFGDGHDVVTCVLWYRLPGETAWTETPMTFVVNDRWRGEFVSPKLGRADFTVVAWVDRFLSWARDFKKRLPTDPDLQVNLQIGAELITAAATRARAAKLVEEANWLQAHAQYLVGDAPIGQRHDAAIAPELGVRMIPFADRTYATQYEPFLSITIDPVKARFSTWYELFPRSCSPEAGKHGTLKDVAKQLPRVANMGFDVLYLPPIHPIGTAYRKGKNNATTAAADDVGSPWGIGADDGGHTEIHAQLGTLEDFHELIAEAKKYDIDIAMDIAYQCSPDHPWVKEHPQWFRARPDGTIQYAENPPKKYQDIYPIDFETDDWENLWQALAEVVFYWVKQGVTVFRVDNPHTKAFPFWEWMIAGVKAKHPEAIFLAEAFTRPKIMYRLAKVGFTQSYTYFSWRNTKSELTEYFADLKKVNDFFRPNLWPNTPDINPEFLQWSGRPGHVMRLVLAATLGASYGMYGPVFELGVVAPVAPGKEEYLDSEKYQITQWKLGGDFDLSEIIARVNRIRRENVALQSDRTLMFHPVDNPEMLCYSKFDIRSGNRIVVVVNLDPNHVQSGWVNLQLDPLKLDGDRPYQMHDMLAGGHYLWHGGVNYLSLNPHVVPAHVFVVRQHVKTEQDFDYFM